jgi:tryptophanyl-tRNA synthetase
MFFHYLINILHLYLTDHFKDYNYGNLKKEVADVVVDSLKVIQDKYNEIMNSNQINEILDSGRDKTMQIAKEKTYEVFKKVGFGRY